jgi:hypothetical protein
MIGRFKSKYKRLVLNHPGDKIYPFPDKNKVRWAIVNLIPKYPCIYEGKPSTQAIEWVNKQGKINIYLMEFDRAGVFFIQTVERGKWNPHSYVAVNQIFQKYHGLKFPDKYLKEFLRPERKVQELGIRR